MTEKKLVACKNCRHCATTFSLNVCMATPTEKFFDAYSGMYLSDGHKLCKDVNIAGTCESWKEILQQPEKALLQNRISTTWTTVRLICGTLFVSSAGFIAASPRFITFTLLCLGGIFVTVLVGLYVETVLRCAAKKKGIM